MLLEVPSTANARPMLPSHCYKLLMDQSTLNRLVEKCGMKVHMCDQVHAEEEVKSDCCIV